MISKSMMLADAVLAMVDFLSGDLNLYLEPYQNGREHGWALTKFGNFLNNKKVVFSQDRHSDRVVVYMGRIVGFSPQGNVPSDSVYNNRMFFSNDAIYKCAEYIVQYLLMEK